MFGKLKDKLKNWAGKFSKSVEKEAEEVVDEAKEEIIEKIKEPIKKEIAVPMKFEVGEQKFEPDLEKLKEIEKKIPKPTKEEKEREKEEEIEESEGFFSKIKSKITKVKISEKEFDIYAEELEMLLLENNVALEVAEKIVKDLKEKIIGKELLKKEIEGEIHEAFKDIIYEILPIILPNLPFLASLSEKCFSSGTPLLL